MNDDKYVTLTEAGNLFPGPLSRSAVRHRIIHGIGGVKLAAQFDGRRYWVCQRDVDDFLSRVSKSQVVAQKDNDKLEARYLAAMSRI